jgi:phage baseplate assembly protein V
MLLGLSELSERIEALESAFSGLIRVGVVKGTFPERAAVKVELSDRGTGTHELPVIFEKTKDDKSYFMPDIGEHVVCIFLPSSPASGFVVGGIYSKADTVPVSDQDKWHKLFKDGSYIEYDRKKHVLHADIRGNAEVVADNNIKAEAGNNIECSAGKDITAEAGGNISASANGNISSDAGGTSTVTGAAGVNINSSTAVTITAPSVAIASAGGGASCSFKGDMNFEGSISLAGSLDVDGSIHASGTIIDDGGNTPNHSHG